MNLIKGCISKYWWIIIPTLFVATLYLYIGNLGTCILGGDWSFPCNSIQAKSLVRDSYYGWNYIASFLGGQQTNLYTALLFNVITYLIGQIIGYVNLYLVLAAFYILAFGYGIHRLQLFYEWKSLNALVGMVVILGLPLYFNYLIMGWINFLIVVSFLPLYIYNILKFIGNENEKFSKINALGASIIFSASSLQSQGPIIYLLVLFVFFLANFNLKFLKFIGLNIIIFMLLNLYWVLPTIFFPPQLLTDKNVLNSNESIGTGQYLTFFNSIRGWGVLANYQYEIIVGTFGAIAAFSLPILSISGLVLKPSKKIIPFIIFILLSIIFIYINKNRYILNYIPFSTVIRDLSRINSVTIIFWGILLIFSLENFYKYCNRTTYSMILIICMIAISVFYYPYYSGAFAKYEQTKGMDFRIRLYTQSTLPPEIVDLMQSNDGKVLYLPIGGLVQSINSEEFSINPFNSFWDLEAAYSELHGSIQLTDRIGSNEKIIYKYLFQNINRNIIDKFVKYNIKYIIFRKDLYNEYSYIDSQILHYLKNNSKADKIFTNKYYEIYGIDNSNKKFIIESNDIKTQVNYRKIDQTFYELYINTGGLLYFNDNYSKNWKIIRINFSEKKDLIDKLLKLNLSIIDSEKDLLNTNKFNVLRSDSDKNNRYFLIFLPQIFFYFSLFISSCSLILVIRKLRKYHAKKNNYKNV